MSPKNLGNKSNFEGWGLTLLFIKKCIQGHSAIFSHVQAYWRTIRHTEAIQTLLRHNAPYSDIFRNLCKLCLYNRGIFRTLAYSEPKTSSKACRTFKMIRHIQSPGIVKTIYSSILRISMDIQGYWCIFSHAQALFFFAKHFILNVRQCFE